MVVITACRAQDLVYYVVAGAGGSSSQSEIPSTKYGLAATWELVQILLALRASSLLERRAAACEPARPCGDPARVPACDMVRRAAAPRRC